MGESKMLVILWIVGALVAIVVLAMLLVPMFIDEQALLELAKEQVQTQTGGELVVERAQVVIVQAHLVGVAFASTAALEPAGLLQQLLFESREEALLVLVRFDEKVFYI